MSAMVYLYYYGKQVLCLLVIYYLSRKAYLAYSQKIIKYIKYFTIALMIILTANLLFSMFYPGNKDDPSCPGILSQNLVIAKIASILVMMVFILTGSLIYRKISKYIEREMTNDRELVRAKHFLKKLKVMIIVFFISVVTDFSMNVYHLILQSINGQAASCDLTNFKSIILNEIIYELYRLLTFFVPILTITYFFWISPSELSTKLSKQNLLDSPDIGPNGSPSVTFFSSLQYNRGISHQNVGYEYSRHDSSISEDDFDLNLSKSRAGLGLGSSKLL